MRALLNGLWPYDGNANWPDLGGGDNGYGGERPIRPIRPTRPVPGGAGGLPGLRAPIPPIPPIGGPVARFSSPGPAYTGPAVPTPVSPYEDALRRLLTTAYPGAF